MSETRDYICSLKIKLSNYMDKILIWVKRATKLWIVLKIIPFSDTKCQIEFQYFLLRLEYLLPLSQFPVRAKMELKP